MTLGKRWPDNLGPLIVDRDKMQYQIAKQLDEHTNKNMLFLEDLHDEQALIQQINFGN